MLCWRITIKLLSTFVVYNILLKPHRPTDAPPCGHGFREPVSAVDEVLGRLRGEQGRREGLGGGRQQREARAGEAGGGQAVAKVEDRPGRETHQQGRLLEKRLDSESDSA